MTNTDAKTGQKCPECLGLGQEIMIPRGPRFQKMGWLACAACKGTGVKPVTSTPARPSTRLWPAPQDEGEARTQTQSKAEQLS